LDESIVWLANNSLASSLTASISTYSCLLQSIQLQWGSSLVRVLTRHDRKVALVLERIQWQTTLIIALGVTLRICYCVTRTMQISG
jgi:hypothetical protein